MPANDNASIPPADPRLRAEAIAACDWACTIPGDVSLVKHPDFQKHFGKLSSDQVTLAGKEMQRRGYAAEAEARALRAEAQQLREGGDQSADLSVYATFLTQLAERLDRELAAEIKIAKDCDLIDDPDDETELVGIDLRIGEWRCAIRNLTIIRDMLNALSDLAPAEPAAETTR